MGISFDFNKMAQLLDNFYILTNVRYSMTDSSNNLLCKSKVFGSPFCQKLRKETLKNGQPADDLCIKCDESSVTLVTNSKVKFYQYRCHAQILETIIPIFVSDEIIAYIFLGQFLDDSGMEKQWEETKKVLESKIDNVEKFKEEFFQLQVMKEQQLLACVEIIVACFNYISAECLIKNSPISNFQLLHDHIHDNFADEISLTTIAKDLSISKTKLCSIAKSHGTTVSNMIKKRRLKMSKKLLENTTLQVSEVAMSVGIADYAYFTKQFKAEFKMTPSQYKKLFSNVRS